MLRSFPLPFFPHFGRLPYNGLSLGLIVVSGLAEGLGLSLFVPLLEILGGGEQKAAGGILALITNAFDAVGVPVTVPWLLAAIAVSILFSLVLAYGQRHAVIVAKHSFIREIRNRMSDAFFCSSWAHFSGQSHGATVNRMVTEAHRAGQALLSEVMCVATLIQIAVFLALAATVSWPLMAVCIVFGAVIFLVVGPLLHHGKKLGNDTVQYNRDLSFHVLDFLRGGKLIKATGTEESVTRRLKGFIDAAVNVSRDSGLNQVQIYFLAQAFPVILLVGIIAVAHEVLGLPTSLILVFLLILARIAPRLAQFYQVYQGYLVVRPALEDLDATLAELDEAREEFDPEARRFDKLETAIELRDVSYHYGDDTQPALRGVSLTIPRQSMIALVGSSGSGKSTLVEILTGIRRANSGQVLIDGIDLWDFDLQSWRRRIGYVTQDIIVFNDTVRNNLKFAHPEASDDEIMARLETARFTEVLARLPEGLGTVLGEGGVRLSGGERQRLTLARALMGEPEVLILDEATSALDNESEYLIQEAIDAVAQELTIVVIAHRLSTVRRADRIYVLENGCVDESGNFDELASGNDTFRNFVELSRI